MTSTKEFTFLQLLNVVDGRLFTTVANIKDLFSHLSGTELFTHELPEAYDQLKQRNPDWFQQATDQYTQLLITNRWTKETDWTTIRDHVLAYNHLINVPAYEHV